MASSFDPQDAREVLGELDVDRARLARKIVTPWWYYPIYSLSMAVLVVSQVLNNFSSMGLALVALIVFVSLRAIYNRRYGLSFTRSTGPGTRGALVALVIILVLSMVAARVIQSTQVELWWAAIPAVIAAVAGYVLGRRYDSALRREVAAG
ncbi:MAG TPA: hypothetical protein VKZ73_07730 [Microbacterium sp.]|nr:hypothetical protein [Microbacterium sp.]